MASTQVTPLVTFEREVRNARFLCVLMAVQIVWLAVLGYGAVWLFSSPERWAGRVLASDYRTPFVFFHQPHHENWGFFS